MPNNNVQVMANRMMVAPPQQQGQYDQQNYVLQNGGSSSRPQSTNDPQMQQPSQQQAQQFYVQGTPHGYMQVAPGQPRPAYVQGHIPPNAVHHGHQTQQVVRHILIRSLIFFNNLF